MFKKIFFITVLVALLAALLHSAAYADQIKVKDFAQVDKYAVLSARPLILEFKGHLGCDKAVVSGSVSGKAIYANIADTKIVGGGKACDDKRNRTYTKQITYGSLVPGTYTVYVNLNSNGKWQKKFQVVIPLAPTPTPAPAK